MKKRIEFRESVAPQEDGAGPQNSPALPGPAEALFATGSQAHINVSDVTYG